MERTKKIFIWNSQSGKFPWCVALGRNRIVARMGDLLLAQDYAKKLRGKEINGCFGQEPLCVAVDEFARFVLSEPE